MPSVSALRRSHKVDVWLPLERSHVRFFFCPGKILPALVGSLISEHQKSCWGGCTGGSDRFSDTGLYLYWCEGISVPRCFLLIPCCHLPTPRVLPHLVVELCWTGDGIWSCLKLSFALFVSYFKQFPGAVHSLAKWFVQEWLWRQWVTRKGQVLRAVWPPWMHVHGYQCFTGWGDCWLQMSYWRASHSAFSWR